VPGPALDILAEELRLAQTALNSITGNSRLTICWV